MKYWLSHLPLEVWVDVYRHPWIKRKHLGRIVDRFGNRKFVEYLQFYLHDWGRRTLKELDFVKKKVHSRRKKKPAAAPSFSKPIPQTPLPVNIKHFECINISHFDQHTVDFLRQIRTLLVDINLDIDDITPDNLGNLRTLLAHLVPLLNNDHPSPIHSLRCSVLALPTVGQLFGGEKLAKLKMLTIFHEGWEEEDPLEEQLATIQSIMEWLTTQQDGIGAKWCDVGLTCDASGWFFEQFIAAIRQDFLAAKKPCTFALFVHPVCWKWKFAGEFHLENGGGEELHGVRQFDKEFTMEITRHPANCAEQLQEWIMESQAKRYSGHSKICMERPTIGSIDALEDADAPEDKAKDQQPSTSKDA